MSRQSNTVQSFEINLHGTELSFIYKKRTCRRRAPPPPRPPRQSNGVQKKLRNIFFGRRCQILILNISISEPGCTYTSDPDAGMYQGDYIWC